VSKLDEPIVASGYKSFGNEEGSVRSPDYVSLRFLISATLSMAIFIGISGPAAAQTGTAAAPP